MKLSIRECPLCKGILGARYPAPGSGETVVRYVCSTHVKGDRLSHYYIENYGIGYVQIIHLPPYVIVNKSNSENTEVYPYEGVGTGHITDRKLIMSIPRLPITTAEKMLERLKVLVVFS